MPLGRRRRHEFRFPHFGFGRGGRTRPRAEATPARRRSVEWGLRGGGPAWPRRGAESVERMWSIPARSRTRADSAQRDCPQAFHAGRALGELTRAKTPNANGAPLMPPASADRPDAAPEEDPCPGSGRRPPSSSRGSPRTRPGPAADSCGRPGKSGRPSSAA